jgi:hypothetical protein
VIQQFFSNESLCRLLLLLLLLLPPLPPTPPTILPRLTLVAWCSGLMLATFLAPVHA